MDKLLKLALYQVVGPWCLYGAHLLLIRTGAGGERAPRSNCSIWSPGPMGVQEAVKEREGFGASHTCWKPLSPHLAPWFPPKIREDMEMQ